MVKNPSCPDEHVGCLSRFNKVFLTWCLSDCLFTPRIFLPYPWRAPVFVSGFSDPVQHFLHFYFVKKKTFSVENPFSCCSKWGIGNSNLTEKSFLKVHFLSFPWAFNRLSRFSSVLGVWNIIFKTPSFQYDLNPSKSILRKRNTPGPLTIFFKRFQPYFHYVKDNNAEIDHEMLLKSLYS